MLHHMCRGGHSLEIGSVGKMESASILSDFLQRNDELVPHNLLVRKVMAASLCPASTDVTGPGPDLTDPWDPRTTCVAINP